MFYRYGQHGDPNRPTNHGCCKWCGRELRAYRYPEHFPTNPDPRGDYGDGHFCGLRCAYRFAITLAGDGFRIKLRPVGPPKIIEPPGALNVAGEG